MEIQKRNHKKELRNYYLNETLYQIYMKNKVNVKKPILHVKLMY